MDRRRILLIVAAIVAAIGVMLVFLYVKGADNRALSQFDNVTVLKATGDIAAGESYDDALKAGKIAAQPVPRNQLVNGYQTDTNALAKTFASEDIKAGEQILDSQFDTTRSVDNSSLGIPKGKVAISINLTDPDRVAGNVNPGAQVAIFATAIRVPPLTPSPLSTQDKATKILLPKVLVLNVGSPQPTTSTTTTDAESGTQTTETLPRTLLTLAVSQQEAQKVILASKTQEVTFALLTNTSKIDKNLPDTNQSNEFK